MIIEESVEIQAPLTVVWRVSSTMEDWQSWNKQAFSSGLDDR